MKRSVFIKAAAATAIVITIPAVYFSSRRKEKRDPLLIPYVLGKFCDDNEIRSIGSGYISLMPAENNREKITELLLSDNNGKKNGQLNNSEIQELLEKKIYEEFSSSKTIKVNGWLISPTEARQCALFSLTQN
jgi:hypothetical protein